MAYSSPASAHNPNGCKANGIDLTLAKSLQVVRQGEPITFLVGIQNQNSLLGLPCNITGASVGLHLPNANGNYDPSSSTVTVTSNQAFPTGFAFQQVGSYDWVVKLNPDVQFAYTLARVSGTLHDTDPDKTFANVVKDIGFQVTNPKITLDKIGSITSGQAPQNVTYTYLVRNESTTPVAMNRVGVSDDLCTNPTYIGGDDGDQLLSNKESWTFSCSTLHQAPGVYTNTATACAYSTVPGDETKPVCSPPDTWTVTLDAPPPQVVDAPPPPPPVVDAPPQVAIKPLSVSQAPCTLATTSKTTVRARQLNTIRVRVRNVDAGTKVTLTLPGGKKVTAKANKDGLATFRVRPTKSGTASIKAAECSDVERLSVKSARRVVAQRAPRVTG